LRSAAGRAAVARSVHVTGSRTPRKRWGRSDDVIVADRSRGDRAPDYLITRDFLET
jgi:hypothetical protein